MGTNATIAAKFKNDNHISVYLNFDGYPEHVAPILLNHYNTYEKVLRLLVLGDLSELGKFDTCPEGHTYDNPARDHCVYYGRDRGETDTEARISPKISNYGQYTYYFDGQKWLMNGEPLTLETIR